mmetsp:Transcript_93389/g.171724  ORF Transcript_93389/g.171724 Transcript_93389/m.171724 type:complete len:233 (-) Transcript_93389:103-801(-)
MAKHMPSDEVNDCDQLHGLKERQVSEASTTLPSSAPMSREVSPDIDHGSADDFEDFPDFGDDHVGFLDFVDQVYGSGLSKLEGCKEVVCPTRRDVASTASAQEFNTGSSTEDLPDFGDDYPGFLEFIDQRYGSGFNELKDEGVLPTSNVGQSDAPAQKKQCPMLIGVSDVLFLLALVGVFMYAFLNSLSFRITAGALTASWFAIGFCIDHAWFEDSKEERLQVQRLQTGREW